MEGARYNKFAKPDAAQPGLGGKKETLGGSVALIKLRYVGFQLFLEVCWVKAWHGIDALIIARRNITVKWLSRASPLSPTQADALKKTNY